MKILNFYKRHCDRARVPISCIQSLNGFSIKIAVLREGEHFVEFLHANEFIFGIEVETQEYAEFISLLTDLHIRNNPHLDPEALTLYLTLKVTDQLPRTPMPERPSQGSCPVDMYHRRK
ncbi:hypothetical protein [Cobetia sp. L2A1]|uniref:hypothetical protein n=1 Tax=Cobetia sp. L2A1 TaxID=2686360 RepID=UPI00131AD892|nr:hypothetical protein [Cobetia sp. L2A1]